MCICDCPSSQRALCSPLHDGRLSVGTARATLSNSPFIKHGPCSVLPAGLCGSEIITRIAACSLKFQRVTVGRREKILVMKTSEVLLNLFISS